MKKIFFVALLSMGVSSYAQVQKGNVVIDGYYGGPNLWKAVIKGIISDSTNASGFGVGPVGIRGEYLVSDKVGVGIDFIYTSAGIRDNASNGSIQLNITRVIPSFNYHIPLSDEMDSYIQAGLGFSSYKFTNSVNSLSVKVPGSIAVRLAYGIRYYFTENIGVNASFGFGGPLWSAGLTVKL